MMTTKGKGDIDAGRYYERDERTGELKPHDAAVPDRVVCRRLVDFPHGQAPAGGTLDRCRTCGEVIVYNARNLHIDRPRHCMQCSGIEPLPIAPEV